MKKILSIIKLGITESFIYRLLKYKYKFPGLNINPTATLVADGKIQYRHGASIGKNSFIRISQTGSLSIGENCYLGDSLEIGTDGLLSIGDNTTIQHRSTILGDVSIGQYCTFGPNVYLSSGNHNFDLYPSMYIRDQDKLVADDALFISRRSKKVVVEDDCWLGINVAVMPGVVIGKGAIVGASSIVTRNVAPYAVVAGIPARLIRKRLDFTPPADIDASNHQDWPYFYSGFCLSKEELDQASKYGGIATKSEFVVCLNATLGRKIHLKVKSFNDVETLLRHHSTCLKINTEFTDFEFEIDNSELNMFRFSVTSENENTRLIVQKVWIQ